MGQKPKAETVARKKDEIIQECKTILICQKLMEVSLSEVMKDRIEKVLKAIEKL